MIVKRNFSPGKVWGYIRVPMLFVLVWSVAVWLAFYYGDLRLLAFNFTPVGVLGSALAIFVAFRNNSAYGRWWEARTIWGGIISSSRTFARLIITFSDSHAHQEHYQRDRSQAFKQSLAYLQLAWVNALRITLREQESWEELQPFVAAAEYEEIRSAANKPTAIQLLMGRQIYVAMANGTLGGFDSFQLEGQLLALSNYQAAAERIKTTPLPRQYDYFTRVFIYLFVLLLPFGLLGFFTSPELLPYSWLTIVLSLLIAGVFIVMERTGAANEEPFENRVTDVALTACCNTIERDVKEMLGEQSLPKKLVPVNGYLY